MNSEPIIRIPLAHILARATERPQGYVDEVLAAGILINGETLQLSHERYRSLLAKYALDDPLTSISRPCCGG